MPITNDQEFKAALAGLSIAQQRQVAARFVQRVFPLSNDARVKAALDAASRPEMTDAELAIVSQAANTARVESYTQCGKETDWCAQSGHFVANAALACVKLNAGNSLAWEAAMQVRLARTCMAVDSAEGTENSESEAQYRILEAFLNH